MLKSKAQQQTGGAAGTTVAIILGLIILYILFLPPDDRADLLGIEDSSSSGTTGSSSGTTGSSQTQIDTGDIFSVSPGNINHLTNDEYEYDLPSFNLFSTTETQVLEKYNNFYIKNCWFDKRNAVFSFKIDDIDNTNNVLLSFAIKSGKGLLGIKANSEELQYYAIDTNNPEPIKIPKSFLKEGSNSIEFFVSGTGMAFWNANEYSIENLQVIADITDESRKDATSQFYVDSTEAKDIETSELRFSPECRQTDIGKLHAYVNGIEVFNAIPDCGMLNKIVLEEGYITEGRNTVSFLTDKGSYLVDTVSVKTQIKDSENPVYYFSLDNDLFTDSSKDEPKCGEIDDFCPDGCDEDADKDCCFEKYTPGYWCDIPTNNSGDRCVGNIESCARCKSGYEDKNGYSPDGCDDICGDDHDGDCFSGCRPEWDKDCCFDLSGDQFFCDDLPITGTEYICVNSVSSATCKFCTTRYDGEDSNPECTYDKDDSDTESDLKSGYHVVLKVYFADDSKRKEAEILINGQKTGFDTNKGEWVKTIDTFVEPYDNSIKIVPMTDLEIRSMKVEVKD